MEGSTLTAGVARAEQRHAERQRIAHQAQLIRRLAGVHVTGDDRPEPPLNHLVELVTEALGTDASWIHLHEPGRAGRARLTAAHGLDSFGRRQLDIVHVGDGVTGAALGGTPGGGRETEPGTLLRPMRPVLATPIIDRGTVIGALGTMALERARRLGSEELQLLDAYATHASTVIAACRAHREARRELELRSHLAATRDPLTGLRTRAGILEALDRVIADNRSGRTTVVVIDIDSMSTINDLHGLEAGDSVLATVAERLDHLVPGMVGRLGGDEFVLVVPDGDTDTRARIGRHLHSVLGHPILLPNGTRIDVTVSLGIVVAPDAHEQPAAGLTDAAGLVTAADLALMRARRAGPGASGTFDPTLREDVRRRTSDEAALRAAIAGNELHVAYQPVIDTRTGGAVGVEALVRWNHPSRGPLTPGHFVPMAEEIGVIDLIDTWVFDRACADLAAWRATDPRCERLHLAVNTSAGRFGSHRFGRDVAAVLQKHQLPAGRVAIEITESTMMECTPVTAHTINELLQLGVRIMIDDFGTGYSSLRNLQQFPVGVVKIDRGFVAGLGRRPEDEAIIGATVMMAGSLGLELIAEGVEEEHQLDHLRALGCHLVQGYLFARPLPGDLLLARLLDPEDPISLR